MTYKIQIDDLVRDATLEEIAVIEAREAEAIAKEQAEAAEAQAKAAQRRAIADRLGLTADDLAVLLG
jgi:hypothetical protein